MSSVNKVILIGNVGNDPEVRYLEKGAAVAEFPLATTERGYVMQNGTQVPDKTEWHSIVMWRGLAEWAERYVRKGMKLYIEGKLQTRYWEKDGIRRQKTEIVADNIQILWRPDAQQPQRQEDPYLSNAKDPQAGPTILQTDDSASNLPIHSNDSLPF